MDTCYLCLSRNVSWPHGKQKPRPKLRPAIGLSKPECYWVHGNPFYNPPRAKVSIRTLFPRLFQPLKNPCRRKGSSPKFPFLSIPLEIRIQIYKFCIVNARVRDDSTEELTPITVCLRGKVICISGIQALPLLFTNKQIYNELQPLAVSNFTNVVVIFGFEKELRKYTQTTYPALAPLYRWPYLQKSMTSLKIHMLAKRKSTLVPGAKSMYHSADETWTSLLEFRVFIEGAEKLEKMIVIARAHYDLVSQHKIQAAPPGPSGAPGIQVRYSLRPCALLTWVTSLRESGARLGECRIRGRAYDIPRTVVSQTGGRLDIYVWSMALPGEDI